MKKILLSSLLVCSLFANEQNNYIEFGVGQMQDKDNFSTDSKELISSFDKAKNENDFIAYLGFNFEYDLNENIELYTNSKFQDLNLGSRFNTKYGLFDIALIGNFLSEEWKNPYLLNSKREKTKVKEIGARLAYTFSALAYHEGTVSYKFSKKDYKNDLLEKEYSREGKRHLISFDNNFSSNINQMPITYLTNLSYEFYDAKGKVHTYDNKSASLGANLIFNKKLDLTLLGSFSKKEYDSYNKYVEKKVHSNSYGLTAILNCQKPLDYENTYLSLKLGHNKENANADFFDKENSFALLSLGYRF